MVGSILALAYFILKLPVALARAPSKISKRLGCSTKVVFARHKMAGTRTWEKCCSVF
jgi:hypothetical protein